MAKIKTARKGFMDVSELNALQQSYGDALSFYDYKRFLLAPVIFTAGFALLLFHSIIITIICGILGGLYAFKAIMPLLVRREYEMKSLNERNRFINSLTQILTDEQKILLVAIELASERTSGELKADLKILQARLDGANRTSIATAFSDLRKKYEKDVLFGQYLEQIETALIEGRQDIEAIKHQKTYHNDTMQNTVQFLKVKEEHYKGVKLVATVIAFIVILITFSFGYETYHEAFTNTLIGNVFGVIFYATLLLLMKSFLKLYFDDEVMSIGKYQQSPDEKNEESEKIVKEKAAPQTPRMIYQTRKIWLSLINKQNYDTLVEMQNCEAMIINWAFGCFVKIFGFCLLGLIGFLLLENILLLVLGMGLAFVYYGLKMQSIKSMFMQYKFERQLEFAKITRLVIPHLKAKGASNMYTVFDKVLKRLKSEEDELVMMGLMEAMVSHPEALQPFIDYAQKMSKTDKAILFMNTVYDIKQGSADMNVIDEMDRLMSADLMTSIDEIIAFKEKKFALFSTKLTMTTIIFFIGVVISFLFYKLTSSGFTDIFGGR